MQLKHAPGAMSVEFDDPNLVSAAGLVPVLFLCAFTFGHVRQLDAVAARVLHGLAVRAPILPTEDAGSGFVFVDIDDTVIEVHSARKQGAGIGYSRVRGLNAAIVTASTASAAPVILGQRLRRGQVNSPRGADRLIGDALALLRRTGTAGPVLMRARTPPTTGTRRSLEPSNPVRTYRSP